MLKRLVSRRPSHGTVVAYIALFIALGGTAYAANEWTGRNIVNGSIKNVDLGANSVNGAKVANNSIKGADVLESSLGIVPKAKEASSVAPDAVAPAGLAQVPAVNTLRIGTAEIASSTANKVLHPDFDIYDTANVHDEGAASEYLIAPVDGMYVVSATVDWDPNGTGYRRTTITGPSGPVASVAGPPLPAPGYTSQHVSGIERLAAGQGVRVEVLQGTVGDLAARLSRFQMTYVGGY